MAITYLEDVIKHISEQKDWAFFLSAFSLLGKVYINPGRSLCSGWSERRHLRTSLSQEVIADCKILQKHWASCCQLPTPLSILLSSSFPLGPLGTLLIVSSALYNLGLGQGSPWALPGSPWLSSHGVGDFYRKQSGEVSGSVLTHA